MAVRLIVDKKEYVGVAADTKPPLTAGSVGAKFFTLDNGFVYIWDGDSWELLEKLNIA